MKYAFVVVALALAELAFSVLPAHALPTFADAYGVQCSTCHTAVPELNSYGRYVQRTGYAVLNRDLLKAKTPFSFHANPTFDTSNGSGRTELGNIALHAGGYLSPSITYHIHQWFAEDGNTGGLDVMQVAYNFKNDLHLFAGKFSALPVPAPYSNTGQLSPFAGAEIQVGEHMYSLDMMRWGASLSFVKPKHFAQIGWSGSGEDWNGATDFSASTDKTFQWITAYADPSQPLEAGLFGSIGSLPLAQGGVDHYNTIAAYVQRDPGPKYVPGLFAVYQIGNDGNSGNPDIAMEPDARHLRLSALHAAFRPLDEGATGTVIPARSQALTLEAYQPLFNGRAIVALRKEFTNDGLGNVANTAAADLYLTPMPNYQYLHLYFEGATRPGMGPAWKGMAWWMVPIGGK